MGGIIYDGDPYWDKVVLAMRMDGADNGTVFTDIKGKLISRYGSVHTSAAVKKFGTAAAFFDGGVGYLQIPYAPDSFRWWDSDFTLQMFVFPIDLDSYSYIDGSIVSPVLVGNSSVNSTVNYWSFGPIASGKVMFRYWSGSSNAVTSTESVVENQWNHIALVVKDGKISIFVNGIVSVPATINGTPQDSISLPLVIGGINSRYINGYVDDILITNGVARYTENFSVPVDSFAEYYARLEGAAVTASGPAVDKIAVFPWMDGVVRQVVTPAANGGWEARLQGPGQYGVTYMASGHQPITHGPYNVGL